MTTEWREALVEALVEALRVLQQTPDSRRSNAHKNVIGKIRTALATPREPDSSCSECGAKFEDARGHAPTCSRYPHDWSSASTGDTEETKR